MAKGPLSNDEFFARLGELFASRKLKGHGSVFLCQKRLTYGVDPSIFPAATPSAPFPDLYPTEPLPVLVRATNGKSKGEDGSRKGKIKISTVVSPDDLEGFYARYADVCKHGMGALRPRDKSKKKAKAKATKKKSAAAAAAAASGAGAGS